MASESDITLYTAQTPNGIKISILLEELGLPYKVHKVDFSTNEQKSPEFLKINPNGRIPALTDKFTDGEPINLFESGSIMQYLVSRYDKEHKLSFPDGTRETYAVNNWLFFMNAGVGPMQGQANHFRRYAPETIQYGIDRYTNEASRLYSVLDAHLADGNKEYLVGNKCTIADIAHWGWIAAAAYAGVDMEQFPALRAWDERMTARSGVEKGRHVPDRHRMKDLTKEELDKQAEEGRKWVQKGMKEDAQKLQK
ncbi:glutathione S-transferase [Aulographum hederae CBS 113979]|uniref:Glutathione S-transferase n=1 Tax=Aulographum hederae CBS 113979 TaxID=1176131 RepID=A0A6G1GWY1_9PEZI|nr:glutathione S-transferase [Aulographum hederae CBS 113979]